MKIKQKLIIIIILILAISIGTGAYIAIVNRNDKSQETPTVVHSINTVTQNDANEIIIDNSTPSKESAQQKPLAWKLDDEIDSIYYPVFCRTNDINNVHIYYEEEYDLWREDFDIKDQSYSIITGRGIDIIKDILCNEYVTNTSNSITMQDHICGEITIYSDVVPIVFSWEDTAGDMIFFFISNDSKSNILNCINIAAKRYVPLVPIYVESLD